MVKVKYILYLTKVISIIKAANSDERAPHSPRESGHAAARACRVPGPIA